MATWRRKALELFPALRGEIGRGDATIYTLFFELLPRYRAAHRAGDETELHKIYDYAQWCFGQKNLRNAAAVAFYEHLGDAPETRNEMPKWIKYSIFVEVAGLLEWRMDKLAFAKLKEQFERLCSNAVICLNSPPLCHSERVGTRRSQGRRPKNQRICRGTRLILRSLKLSQNDREAKLPL